VGACDAAVSPAPSRNGSKPGLPRTSATPLEVFIHDRSRRTYVREAFFKTKGDGMGVVIAVAAVIAVVALVVWVIRNPGPETSMGIENRAGREAKKAAKRKAGEGQSED
jgi:hypothetical protein